MSEQTQTPAGESKYSLVRKILSILKIGDAGKLDSFFAKQVRNLERDVEALEHQKQTLAFEQDRKLAQLSENLEDATAALADAFTAVQPEDVANNALQESFARSYWSRIDHCEEVIDDLQSEIEKLKDKYVEELEDLDEQIKIRKERIASIK